MVSVSIAMRRLALTSSEDCVGVDDRSAEGDGNVPLAIGSSGSEAVAGLMRRADCSHSIQEGTPRSPPSFHARLERKSEALELCPVLALRFDWVSESSSAETPRGEAKPSVSEVDMDSRVGRDDEASPFDGRR